MIDAEGAAEVLKTVGLRFREVPTEDLVLEPRDGDQVFVPAADDYTEFVALTLATRIEQLLRGARMPMTRNWDSPPGVTEAAEHTNVAYDEVAGEIHPWKSGPCAQYQGDGRSDICSTCDWPSGAHRDSITCPRCGRTSYNPNDIAEGYCGNCHDWTTPK